MSGSGLWRYGGKLVKKEVPQLWKRRGKCAVSEVRGVIGVKEVSWFRECQFATRYECLQIQLR